jgi:hypothetical protein
MIKISRWPILVNTSQTCSPIQQKQAFFEEEEFDTKDIKW